MLHATPLTLESPQPGPKTKALEIPPPSPEGLSQLRNRAVETLYNPDARVVALTVSARPAVSACRGP